MNKRLPFNFIIFGANGDLTRRKLIPALYNLYRNNYLDFDFNIIGISRTKYSNQEFRDYLETTLLEAGVVKDHDLWQKFAKHLHYLSFNVKDVGAFGDLKNYLAKIQAADLNKFYYLATSPNLYADIASNLAKSGFVCKDCSSRSDLIVEKPIGHDLESALELNKVFRTHFKESQIYRIDHYLGKETVQNILMFRFANVIFESIWNHKYIDQIEITVAESVGVEGRASYYDSAGCLRDMIQNHLSQLLSLLCIETPVSVDESKYIRDEKVKVLRSIKPFTKEEISSRVIRGQYQAGIVQGKQVDHYLDLEDVAPNSQTETYVALKLEVDNWRWLGVPIILRTGKCLSEKKYEINVFFQKTPDSLMGAIADGQHHANKLTFQIQPNEGISVQFNSKPPGLNTQLRTVDMDFTYQESFQEDIYDAYEKLLIDIVRGDQTLFIREDEVEESWKLLQPILDAWEAGELPLFYYPAGSEGPEEANQLVDGLPHPLTTITSKT